MNYHIPEISFKFKQPYVNLTLTYWPSNYLSPAFAMKKMEEFKSSEIGKFIYDYNFHKEIQFLFDGESKVKNYLTLKIKLPDYECFSPHSLPSISYIMKKYFDNFIGEYITHNLLKNDVVNELFNSKYYKEVNEHYRSIAWDTWRESEKSFEIAAIKRRNNG